jgi:hypothetical protein
MDIPEVTTGSGLVASTAREVRTSSVEENSSADAEALATRVRKGDVGELLIREYKALLTDAKKVLKDRFRPEDDADALVINSERRAANENRKFALSQLQSLLDIALKHTSKRRVTGETQSATAISRDQLATMERLPAKQRDEALLAVDRIQALLKEHGKELNT